MKVCLDCSQSKEDYLFPKKGSYCKLCMNIRSKAYREKYPEKYKASSKRTREKNKEKLRAYYKAWYKEGGRKRKEGYSADNYAWGRNNPEKRRAQQAVKYHIRRGVITRPKSCSICGDEGMISAHHEDYNKPLEVIWMCSSCHKTHHCHKSIANANAV